MEYLNKMLGLKVAYSNENIKGLKNFIHSRYELQKVTLYDAKAPIVHNNNSGSNSSNNNSSNAGKNSAKSEPNLVKGIDVIFVSPKEGLSAVNAMKKHFESIEKAAHAPVVLILQTLSYRQKTYLLRERIPFVVEGKQIYLPFMAIYLQNRGDKEPASPNPTLLPSAQLLLLYYIYHGCGKLLSSQAAKELRFSATSISRASRQLEELELLQTKKQGVQKIIFCDKTPSQLFEISKKYMVSPIKRTIYVDQADIDYIDWKNATSMNQADTRTSAKATESKQSLLLSSYSALSQFSMIAPPLFPYLAANSIAKWEKNASASLQNSDEQCALELWRYNPRKLSTNACVDRLSLALALENDNDERVEQAVETMLSQLWEEINGTRN